MSYEIIHSIKVLSKEIDKLEQRITELEDNLEKHTSNTDHPHEA